jgi:general stress protein 26
MELLDEGYEDLTAFGLDDDGVDRLCNEQNECVFNWSTADGWPVGVVMSFVRRDGRIWLTCARRRKRVPAVQRDDRVSVVISSVGTSIPMQQTVTFKGRCTVHRPEDDDYDELKAWFYPDLVDAIFKKVGESPFKQAFLANLDSPDRVILEVTTDWALTYDSGKLTAATMGAGEGG